MENKQWITIMNRIIANVKEMGGEAEEIIVEAPLKEKEIIEIEETLGIQIPLSYRKVLVECFSYFEWEWDMPEDIEVDEMFEEIYGSRGVLGLRELIECENRRRELVRDIFNEPENLYDQTWKNKLAFFDVGNGDLLAFDLMSDKEDLPVVYLNADDDELHGSVLGENFIDFMDKWSRIGFVGGESWNLQPFLGENGIDPEGENSQMWRRVLKL
ncbi:SMI1/KNR4 family protein [Bacillus paranthracis]|uniref:SMI1/KNR4 family protein n=1 Tax=Bacillus paranthracis TaxID=2026186 RepID=UPI00398D56E9